MFVHRSSAADDTGSHAQRGGGLPRCPNSPAAIKTCLILSLVIVLWTIVVPIVFIFPMSTSPPAPRSTKWYGVYSGRSLLIEETLDMCRPNRTIVPNASISRMGDEPCDPIAFYHLDGFPYLYNLEFEEISNSLMFEDSPGTLIRGMTNEDLTNASILTAALSYVDAGGVPKTLPIFVERVSNLSKVLFHASERVNTDAASYTLFLNNIHRAMPMHLASTMAFERCTLSSNNEFTGENITSSFLMNNRHNSFRRVENTTRFEAEFDGKNVMLMNTATLERVIVRIEKIRLDATTMSSKYTVLSTPHATLPVGPCVAYIDDSDVGTLLEDWLRQLSREIWPILKDIAEILAACQLGGTECRTIVKKGVEDLFTAGTTMYALIEETFQSKDGQNLDAEIRMFVAWLIDTVSAGLGALFEGIECVMDGAAAAVELGLDPVADAMAAIACTSLGLDIAREAHDFVTLHDKNSDVYKFIHNSNVRVQIPSLPLTRNVYNWWDWGPYFIYVGDSTVGNGKGFMQPYRTDDYTVENPNLWATEFATYYGTGLTEDNGLMMCPYSPYAHQQHYYNFVWDYPNDDSTNAYQKTKRFWQGYNLKCVADYLIKHDIRTEHADSMDLCMIADCAGFRPRLQWNNEWLPSIGFKFDQTGKHDSYTLSPGGGCELQTDFYLPNITYMQNLSFTGHRILREVPADYFNTADGAYASMPFGFSWWKTSPPNKAAAYPYAKWPYNNFHMDGAMPKHNDLKRNMETPSEQTVDQQAKIQQLLAHEGSPSANARSQLAQAWKTWANGEYDKGYCRSDGSFDHRCDSQGYNDWPTAEPHTLMAGVCAPFDYKGTYYTGKNSYDRYTTTVG